MHRELNTRAEIVRRLIYIIYLGGMVTAISLGLVALLQAHKSNLAIAAGLGLLTLLLKCYGDRHLDFPRLSKSFPCGSPLDEIPDSLQVELEELCQEFWAKDAPWTRRQELRNRLAALVEQEPRLLEVYRDEITAILPNLRGRLRCDGDKGK
jgi:hypothetical protein